MEDSERNRRERARSPSTPVPWDGLSPHYVRSVAAQRLKALGYPDRLRIIEALNHDPQHVSEVAARLGLPMATISRHMTVLHAEGIVERSRRGNRVLYVLSDREVARLAAVAYRGAAAQARRLIESAPKRPEDDRPKAESRET